MSKPILLYPNNKDFLEHKRKLPINFLEIRKNVLLQSTISRLSEISMVNILTSLALGGVACLIIIASGKVISESILSIFHKLHIWGLLQSTALIVIGILGFAIAYTMLASAVSLSTKPSSSKITQETEDLFNQYSLSEGKITKISLSKDERTIHFEYWSETENRCGRFVTKSEDEINTNNIVYVIHNDRFYGLL